MNDDSPPMMFPVRCDRCGSIYDAAKVTVTRRYADCSVWNTPCCGRQVDDRRWKSLPDFTELTAEDVERLRGGYIDRYGRRVVARIFDQ